MKKRELTKLYNWQRDTSLFLHARLLLVWGGFAIVGFKSLTDEGCVKSRKFCKFAVLL